MFGVKVTRSAGNAQCVTGVHAGKSSGAGVDGCCNPAVIGLVAGRYPRDGRQSGGGNGACQAHWILKHISIGTGPRQANAANRDRLATAYIFICKQTAADTNTDDVSCKNLPRSKGVVCKIQNRTKGTVINLAVNQYTSDGQQPARDVCQRLCCGVEAVVTNIVASHVDAADSHSLSKVGVGRSKTGGAVTGRQHIARYTVI